MNEWICTDPDCNQYRKDISENIFLFKEDRVINFPSTPSKYETFESEINLDDYSIEELLEFVSPYYPKEEFYEWMYKGINKDIIAECIFEQSYD